MSVRQDAHELEAVGVPVERLKILADARADVAELEAAAWDRLLDAVLEAAELDGVNLRALARVAGISHATIYNEITRRRAMTPAGVPAPAPADTDQDPDENTTTEEA